MYRTPEFDFTTLHYVFLFLVFDGIAEFVLTSIWGNWTRLDGGGE